MGIPEKTGVTMEIAATILLVGFVVAIVVYVLSVKAKELAPNQGELSLFTQLPRGGLLGNRASGVRDSRKLNFYHCSFS